MKKLTTLFFVCIFMASLIVPASCTDVVIDGIKVPFNDSTGYPFVNAEGRTMVPLRAAMEAYGATVSWDAEKNTALVTKGVTTVTCTIGENAIYRNGTKIVNDASAQIVGGRTYLPIRAVLEALDAKVSWDGAVAVESPGAGRLIYDIKNNGKKVSNYWKAWTEALDLKNSGQFALAIEKFKEVGPTFLEKSDDRSDAMFYNNLGACYNALGMVNEAIACYKEEANHWDKVGEDQNAIDARRRGTLSESIVQLFATSNKKEYSARRDFGTLYANKTGVLLGVTMKGSNPEYMTEFTNISGKEAGGYILYGYVDSFPYEDAFIKANKRGKVIQYALQPKNLADLLSIVPEDARYVKLAKQIAETQTMTLIRFACEMNDVTSHWYTADYNAYIERFRYVADIFHKYAPNCQMVWSPNFYPPSTMSLYYPGDNYVDFVGVSIYAEYQPDTDPLKQGVDRNRFSSLLDTLVSLYGHKKPIIISECGASYKDVRTGADVTEFASTQIKDFFTYLPIKYPSVVAAYLFETYDSGGREFELIKNPSYHKAFSESVKSDVYMSSQWNDPETYNFEIGNNVHVPGRTVDVHSFVKNIENNVSYVVYRINGQDMGTSYAIPYTVNIDFAPYTGETIELGLMAFSADGKLCAEKTYRVVVDQYVRNQKLP